MPKFLKRQNRICIEIVKKRCNLFIVSIALMRYIVNKKIKLKNHAFINS